MTTQRSQKVLIVTGAGRGIGAATARLAAQRGWDICVNYHQNREAADRVATDIRDTGQHAIIVQGDVSVEADVQRVFARTNSELGPLAALVNNAGVVGRQTRVDMMDAARLQHIFAINVIGSFLCGRAAVQCMSFRHNGRGGAIVNLSSGASRLGAPGEYVDYAASKGAIDTFTVGLAREVADEGIRVNAVRPGIIDTDIHASSGEPGRVERMASSIPLKRGGTAEEVARAILWLLSDEASYVTGAIVDVAGGR